MDDNRIRAYRFLLYKLCIQARSVLYAKKIDSKYAKFIGEFADWVHNLALCNYTDDWEKFDEEYFWQTYDYLKNKSKQKHQFEFLKQTFEDKLNQPTMVSIKR